MKMKKRLTALLLCAVMVFSFASCGSKNAEATQADVKENTKAAEQNTAASTSLETGAAEAEKGGEIKDTIKVALPKKVSEMTGSKGGLNAFNVLFQVYDMLCEMDADMKATPKLATSWEQIDDLTWEFKLREGVKFHDGSDFTAEDAKASIERIVEMEPKYFYAANWVNSWPPVAEVKDDYTLIVKTPVKNIKLPEMLSRVIMVPAEYKEDENFFSETLIGTGAYKFKSWEPGINIVLEAFDGYWDGAPAVKNLQYDFVTDASARLTAFKNGEYDVVFDLPYDSVEELRNNDYRVDAMNLVGVSMVYFNPKNFENSVIKDPRIRQAMSYAIDSYGIVDSIMYGYGHVMEGIAAHNTSGANNGEGLPHQDIEKAQELMKEAGYNGEEINFFYVEGEFNNALEISELIVAQLTEAGFNVKFTEIESGLWSSDYQGKAGWDICVNNVPGTFSGDSDYYWLHCLKNKQGWSSAEVDQWMDKAYEEDTIEGRTADFKEAMGEAWNLWPYLWASECYGLYGVTKNLDGIEYIPLNLLYFRDAEYK